MTIAREEIFRQWALDEFLEVKAIIGYEAAGEVTHDGKT